MVSLARALVINIGTLSDPWIEAMLLTGRKANSKGLPIVFDPVGSGATSLRTATTRKMVQELKLAIIRGNASEILSIGSSGTVTKGVDSLHDVDQVAEMAKATARQTGAVVAVTGKVDLITDGTRVIRCRNGHAMMGRVTGMGCAATATIAAFAAVTPDAMEAAAAGLAFFGLAGEMAAATAQSPGSFMIALIDALYNMTPEDLQARALLEEG
jgi:hydroxyethylthiazole kinase